MKMRRQKSRYWLRIERCYEPRNCLMQSARFIRRGVIVKEIYRFFSFEEHEYSRGRT